MFRLALLVLCVLNCSLELLANSTDAPVPIVTQPDETTTPKPDPQTTTPRPATTATPVNTTTTTTTTSTTTASTTTTIAPIPPPVPNNEVPTNTVQSKIELRDPKANSTLCFKAEFNLQFDVHYNNSKHSLVEKHIYLPKLDEVKPVPGCAQSKNLTVPLAWRWNNQTWNASLSFAANNKTYNLTGVNALFPNDPKFFPGNADNTSQYLSFGNSSLVGFPGHLNRTYECWAEEAVIVQANKFVIKVSHLKVQAFQFKYNDTYNKERDVCSADEPSSTMVPIIVGCVLAGLIVIVIVAYVVATRKFKKYHGYETL